MFISDTDAHGTVTVDFSRLFSAFIAVLEKADPCERQTASAEHDSWLHAVCTHAVLCNGKYACTSIVCSEAMILVSLHACACLHQRTPSAAECSPALPTDVTLSFSQVSGKVFVCPLPLLPSVPFPPHSSYVTSLFFCDRVGHKRTVQELSHQKSVVHAERFGESAVLQLVG